MKLRAKSLAAALFSSLQKSGHEALGQNAKALRDFHEFYSEGKIFRFLVNHPSLSAESKKKLLAAVFKEIPAEPAAVRLVEWLMQEKSLELVPGVSQILRRLRSEAFGVKEVTLKTAEPASDALAKKIEEGLKKSLRAEAVELSRETDASLLGGAVIAWEDKHQDASLRHGLNLLQKTLSLS